MVEKMIGRALELTLFISICSVCSSQDAPTFPSTFYAEVSDPPWTTRTTLESNVLYVCLLQYKYQIVVNNRTAHGEGTFYGRHFYPAVVLFTNFVSVFLLKSLPIFSRGCMHVCTDIVGYMACDGTSRRITSTTIDIAQTGETIRTGLLQLFDTTPHVDYAYLV